jgi:4-amino-4-deoxy-L-arabinose transferase-like glycosyltransferase
MNRAVRLERWAPRFLIALTSAIYVGSAGIPALLDDADSLFAEIGREMNARRDWITPYTNSIRFLEKPPMFYWLTSVSYGVFRSATAFTARLPTALVVVALVFVTYQIGKLVFGWRAGFFGGLALATSAGTFLFTRIVLPEPILTLWLTLLFYAFLRWERAEAKAGPLVWMYVFAGLAVLTKGLIGVVFPAAILFFTLLATGTLKNARQLFSLKGLLLFFVIATPWHVWVALRNPGFVWFYFVNEHVLRFIGGRYPMNYATVPLVPFWLLHMVWLFPWSVYLLAWCRPDQVRRALTERRLGLVLLVAWALTILIFFSFATSRLEYYTVLIFPPLALLAGAQCADCWERGRMWPGLTLASLGVLIGFSMIALAVSATPGAAESFLKLRDNPQLYVFYLGHLFDLTPGSLLALRTPLLLAGFGLGVALPLHQWLNKPEAKGVVLALGMALFFVAADIAFLIFAPRMTSQVLAEEINRRSHDAPTIVIDGEYEEGSSLTFYTHQAVLIHNGRSSDLEYGSYYSDAPHLFIDGAQLKRLWGEPKRVFLLTFVTKQARLRVIVPQAKYVLATYGDKLLISNHPD